MRKLLKPLAIFACAVVLIAGTVAGTLAYLTAKTDPITNTFTVGDINITLTESANLDLKMVPGVDMTKDPKVTVEAGSEDCWLFVKLDKSAGFDTYLTYTIDANVWTALDADNGIYYRKVLASDPNRTFSVLLNDKVTAKSEVSKAQYNDIANAPTLSVTAYAIQLAGFEVEEGAKPTAAWTEVSKVAQNPG